MQDPGSALFPDTLVSWWMVMSALGREHGARFIMPPCSEDRVSVTFNTPWAIDGGVSTKISGEGGEESPVTQYGYKFSFPPGRRGWSSCDRQGGWARRGGVPCKPGKMVARRRNLTLVRTKSRSRRGTNAA